MRALIHELPYEQPIAAGRYQYVEDGQATGAVETWRLSAAREGYHFLRVDLNGAASSGDNVLYHLTLDADGRPQRLKFHFFRQGAQVRGDLLFEKDLVVLSRDVGSRRLESQAPYAPGMPFWFPSAAGLSLLATLSAPVAGCEALTLDRAQEFALWPTTLALDPGPPQPVRLMGREIMAATLTARWADQARTLWLDEHNWPIRVQRGALLANEKRYLRYRAP